MRAQGYTSSSSAAWFYTIMNLGKVLPRKRKKTGADSGSYSAAYLRIRWRQTGRVRPRFFDQVGHKTMYASSGNKHFSLNLVIIRLTKIINRAEKIWAQF